MSSLKFTVISTNSKNSEMNYKETIDFEKYLLGNEQEPRIINKFYNGYGSYYKIYRKIIASNVSCRTDRTDRPKRIVPIMYVHEFREFLIDSKAIYKSLQPYLCHDIIMHIIIMFY